MSHRIMAAVVVLAILVGFGWGDDVEINVQAELYQNLLTCSAIIFGVMGAWIAVIYPRTIDRMRDKPTTEVDVEEEAKVYASLRPAMYTSTLVLAVVLLGAPVAAIATVQDIYTKIEPFALKASMSLILALTGVELYALLTSLAPFVITNDSIADLAERKISDIFIRGKRQKP